MLKQRKIPMRTCQGCREAKPKKELLRVVRSPEGVISFDPIGKAPGRGTYVCPNEDCLNRCEKTKALERQLECAISPEVYAALRDRLKELNL